MPVTVPDSNWVDMTESRHVSAMWVESTIIMAADTCLKRISAGCFRKLCSRQTLGNICIRLYRLGGFGREVLRTFENKINFLKIRGSYGTLGNDNTGGVAFPYYSRFDLYASRGSHGGGLANNLGDYVFGELVTKGLVPGPIANALATWETSKKMNIAIDAGLFDMFNLSLDS